MWIHDLIHLFYNMYILGLDFYYKEQFFQDGRSKWRIPKIWPVDIHNQAQGIITFCILKEFYPECISFAKTILDWTITNMQDKKKGYFYYKKHMYLAHKTPYMRWSQAWMFLAFINYFESNNRNES